MHHHAPFFRLKALLSFLFFNTRVGTLLTAYYKGIIPSSGFFFDIRSPLVLPSTVAALFFGRFETSDCRFVEKYLYPDLDVIQLGGGIGVISCHMSSRLKGNRKIIVVEANPSLIPLLENNLHRNIKNTQFNIINAAVDYSKHDRIKVFISTNFLSTSTSQISGGGCMVPTLTLGEIVSKHVTNMPYQLQMDIEGAEAGLLLYEETGILEQCSQIITEFHETTQDGKRLTVDELIDITTKKHNFYLVDRYGPVCVFRPESAM